jgi:hypothetical protein
MELYRALSAFHEHPTSGAVPRRLSSNIKLYDTPDARTGLLLSAKI